MKEREEDSMRKVDERMRIGKVGLNNLDDGEKFWIMDEEEREKRKEMEIMRDEEKISKWMLEDFIKEIGVEIIEDKIKNNIERRS